jgi:hypothetical protein
MNFPTDTVNVLPHLNDLKKAWKAQDFRLTRQQQEEYDMLRQARKERVSWFYETDRVAKPGERLNREEQEEDDDV